MTTQQSSLTHVDWSAMPRPVDDGAADHLMGLTLPSLVLPATDGRRVDLSALPGLAVVYLYPMTGRPDRPLPDGWDATPGARGCTPQSCAYRDHAADLAARGVAHLFGLSTQATDWQAEAAARLHLPYALLSDADLALTRALRLPTFQAEGLTLLKRCTLILRDGVVVRVHYPVFPPDQDAARVVAWLDEGGRTMIRTLALAAGLAGAGVTSQYPEFTQQYLQRLAGQVDALGMVVEDFDASALRSGLTRNQALEEMAGTAFLADRQADLRRTFRRHAVLADDLATLRAAGPVARIAMPLRVSDPATFAATWSDFQPAMPLTLAGVLSGSVGFVLGWGALRALWAILRRSVMARIAPRDRPARERPARTRDQSRHRAEPVVAAAVTAPSSPVPRLAGVRRHP